MVDPTQASEPLTSPEERLRQSEQVVRAMLESAHVIEAMARRQVGPQQPVVDDLVRRQTLVEVARRLKGIHAADLAHVMTSLPLEDKLLVWKQLGPEQAAAVILEATEAVRRTLAAATERGRLILLLRTMDADDLTFLADDVPGDVLREVSGGLEERGRSWVERTADWPEDRVAKLMVQTAATLRLDLTIAGAVAELRSQQDPLPRRTEVFYVVDARRVVRGVLPLRLLLLGDPEAKIADLMQPPLVVLHPGDKASYAAQAFDRYALVSAPVVDDRGKMLGRLLVDEVVDFMQRRADLDTLRRAGLAGDEDVFAGSWASARNRWLWLAVNVATAFVSSRVIGAFEGTLARLAALAALMPMVASIANNTGQQTSVLVLRAIAMKQLSAATTRHLIVKELTIGLMNGALWGGLMGLFAFALYGRANLGLVMASAVLLNLMVAAVAGVAVPAVLDRLGRDPAQGSSVLLSFLTDCSGFFLFLGLATWALM